MRRIGRLFGRKQNRKSGRTQNRQTKHWSKFSPILETLEERRLLAVNFLGSDVGEIVDGTQMEITVPAGSGTHLLGLQVCSPDGSMDPAVPWIENVNGSIAPIFSTDDMPGVTDSLFLAELGPGTYTVTIKTEHGTAGKCQLDVFLPGDMSGDGIISSAEYNQASAASVQTDGYWNSYTARYYRSLGIDLNVDQYHEGLDVNLDGCIDGFDMQHMYANLGRAGIGLVVVDADINPVIDAGLEVDSGRSDTDGVTNELAIIGSVDDPNGVKSFTVSIDGEPAQNILGDLAGDGSFRLSKDRLEELIGAAIVENTEYTLTFSAEDTLGHTSTYGDVKFTLDTVAPDKPAAPDLVAESDSGLNDDDDITNDATPTFRMEAETGDLVQLYITDIDGNINELVGEEIAASPVEISRQNDLAEGDWYFTTIYTDLAGNASEQSDLLKITLDTTGAEVSEFDLDEASDTETIGDQLTTLTLVTLTGTTEAEVKVALTVLNGSGTPYTAEVDSDGDGKFEFTDVPLAWNQNECTIVTTDTAGNEYESTLTITRNNAPTVVGQTDLKVNNYILEHMISLVDPALFDDLDFEDGDMLTLSIIPNTNTDLLTATLEDGGNAVDDYAQDYVLKLVLQPEMEGTATVTITAKDEVGQTAIAILNIQVVEGAMDDSAETDEGTPVTFDVAWNDYGGTAAVDTILLGSTTSTLGATITDNGDGTLTYNPSGAVDLDSIAVGETLEDTFTYTIEDQDGNRSGPATVTVTVSGVNDAPDAVDDTEDIDENVVATFNVLGNDIDPDTSDTLTVTEATSAAGAAVTILGNGSLQYDPTGVAGLDDLQRGQVATDEIYYTISDGNGGTDTATVYVTITGVNDPPVCDEETWIHGEEDVPYTVDLYNYFSDEETPDSGLTLEQVGIVIGGTADFQPDGHTVIVSKPANDSGYVIFVVKGTDDDAVSPGVVDQRRFFVHFDPINDEPYVDGPVPVLTDENVPVEINLRDYVSDVETADEDLVFSNVTCSNGTVTFDDGYMVEFTPTAGFNGLAEIEFDVTDTDDIAYNTAAHPGDGSKDPAQTVRLSIEIEVGAYNRPPIVDPAAPAIDAVEDTDFDIDLREQVYDQETPDDQLVFENVSATGGTAILDGDGYTVHFSPTPDYAGPASITFDVTDTGDPPDGEKTAHLTIDFTIENVNDDPTAADDSGATNADTATSGSLLGLVDDPDAGDTPEFSPSSGTTAEGAAFTIDPTSGAWTYDPTVSASLKALADGETVDDTFEYTVSDGNGGTATGTITITVTGVNDAPVAVDDDTAETDEETAIDIDVLGNDYDPDNGDTFSLVSVDATSTSGAVITDNGDG
ncbi:MAG: tandem-95 repeat protein, partial [Pirellulales bacterium]|nr:tandem-95 repeat protein [Pirellulales bacterium]